MTKYDPKYGFATYKPKHPRSHTDGYVLEHILMAETLISKSLPRGAVIHHPNGNGDNSVFVICQDQGYHFLLHTRERAFRACGHANWRKCWICKKYDALENLYFPKIKYHCHWHRRCMAAYQFRRRTKQGERMA